MRTKLDHAYIEMGRRRAGCSGPRADQPLPSLPGSFCKMNCSLPYAAKNRLRTKRPGIFASVMRNESLACQLLIAGGACPPQARGSAMRRETGCPFVIEKGPLWPRGGIRAQRRTFLTGWVKPVETMLAEFGPPGACAPASRRAGAGCGESGGSARSCAAPSSGCQRLAALDHDYNLRASVQPARHGGDERGRHGQRQGDL